MASRCGRLLRSPSADARSADDVIVFKGLVSISSNLKRFAKGGVLPKLLQVCFQLLATCIGEDEAEEEADEDERDVGYSAKAVIEALAESAPPELILPMVFKFVTPAAGSTDTRQRWAALHVISAAAGGCGEYIRMTCLNDVMRLVCTLLRDPMLAVRRRACSTLSDLGFYCQPDIAEYSATTLPLLIESIREVSAEMMSAAAEAIEQCLNPDAPPPNVVEHIAPLMQRLMKMCEMDEDVHRIAVSCMGRIAKVTPAGFLPYAPVVLQHLTRIISTPDASEVDLDLVCQALDTVGCIVSSVEDPAPMAQLIKELTELVFNAMARFADPDVTVAGYHYFGSLAESVPAECTALLPRLLPIVHASCTSTQGLPGHGEDLFAGGDDGGEGGAAGGGGGGDVVAVRTSYVQVKETACTLFVALSTDLGKSFLPHAAAAFERVLSLRQGAAMEYASLRQETGYALAGLAASIFTNGSGVTEWKAGLPPPPGLAANVQTALGVAVKAQFELLQDRDRNVVRNGLDAMKIILTAAGPFIFTATGQAEQLMEALSIFLQGKAPCFLDATDEDGAGLAAEDLLTDELTMNVIEDAFDTIVAAAAALGPV